MYKVQGMLKQVQVNRGVVSELSLELILPC